MRVISGTARGRQLIAPDAAGTRPLTDRAREGIFSAIGEGVIDATVLDLYAGSGSIGIEALSRGAAKAVFVENSQKALAALRQNLAATGFGERSTIRPQTVESFLGQRWGTYDLIFFDPPWSLPRAVVARQMSKAATISEPNAEMVAHRRHPEPLPVLPEGWVEAGTYRYGDSCLWRVAAR
jgi:16S rRNA (guanine(966)-N(2))-methyltransferase RsmD